MDSMQLTTSEPVSQLFNLFQNERSPFAISRKGQTAIENLFKANPEYELYRESLTRALSVRIINACKNFYNNIKISKLLTLLPFHNTETEVERLIFELNNEEILFTTISFSDNLGVITFNPKFQVTEKLFNFGQQLHDIFQKVSDCKTQSRQQRIRVF